MREAPVHVEQLRRTFRVPVREGGLRASVRSLVHRTHRTVVAVDAISFALRPGEIVGFLGPNGAGKTTTLKMLSGLLHPDSGVVRVLGHEPFRRRPQYLERIALVMGNRTSMAWDLPALDSFNLQRAIYQVPKPEFEQRRDEFIELLDLQELVKKPVRNLSLGERMKMELVLQLLHRPEVLFLDEPTLGLDVTMQRRLREFVRAYNRENGATVLLTSHYMADVLALCERVIVIHHGRILYDGDLPGLKARFGAEKTVTIAAEGMPDDLSGYGELVERSPGKATFRLPGHLVSGVAARLLADFDVHDVTIQDPPLEEIIERVFASGKPAL